MTGHVNEQLFTFKATMVNLNVNADVIRYVDEHKVCYHCGELERGRG